MWAWLWVRVLAPAQFTSKREGSKRASAPFAGATGLSGKDRWWRAVRWLAYLALGQRFGGIGAFGEVAVMLGGTINANEVCLHGARPTQ